MVSLRHPTAAADEVQAALASQHRSRSFTEQQQRP